MCLSARPTCHLFCHCIEVSNVSGDVGAKHSVPDRVERDLGAFLFCEQYLFRHPTLRHVANGTGKRIRVDMTFQQVVLCSASHGFRGDAFLLCATQDQCRRARRRLQELSERVEALTVGQRQIGDDRPNSFLLESFQALRECRNIRTFEWAVISAKQRLSEKLAVSRVVVHEKQSAHINHVLGLPNATVKRRGSNNCSNGDMCLSGS